MAVENQQPTRSLYTRRYIVVEVLDLIQADLVVGPSVIGLINRLVAWDTSLVVLGSLVVFRGKDNIWW